MNHSDYNREPLHRRIRSFVRREGRMTSAQTTAFHQEWARYGLELSEHSIQFENVFGRTAPCFLEIGFGMGHTLLTLAQTMPEYHFIGVDVYRPGIGTLLAGLKKHHIENVRLFHADAIQVLTQAIADNSLDGIYLFFPDPWPKKRHHKRRIVQPDFAELVLKKLKTGGFLHCATDWEDYAKHMLEVLQSSVGFVNTSEDGTFVPRPPSRPLTKFELRGQRLGHGVWDLIFTKGDST